MRNKEAPPKISDIVECSMPYGSVVGKLVAVHGDEGWVQTEHGENYVWGLDNMKRKRRRALSAGKDAS